MNDSNEHQREDSIFMGLIGMGMLIVALWAAWLNDLITPVLEFAANLLS